MYYKGSFLISLALLIVSCTPPEPSVEGNSVEVKTVIIPLSEAPIDTPSVKVFNQVVQVNGWVNIPPKDKAAVSSSYEGVVAGFNLISGQKIERHQVLFYLKNPDFIAIQEDFLKAKSELDMVRKRFERMDELYRDSLCSTREHQEVLNLLQQTQIHFAAATAKLRLMGFDPELFQATEISSTIAIKSPITGYLSDIQIHEGLYLTTHNPALTLINTEEIHLEFLVYQRYAQQVRLGQELNIELSQKGRMVKAKVFSMDRTLGKEKGLRVHAHLVDERDRAEFIPGSFWEGQLQLSTQKELAIPQRAVLIKQKKGSVLKLIESPEKNSVQHFELVSFDLSLHNDSFVQLPSSFKSQFIYCGEIKSVYP